MMTKKNHLSAIVPMIIVSIMLVACAFKSPESAILYDLGSLPSSVSISEENKIPSSMPRIVVANVSAPAWLDSTMMYYRLAYNNEQQTRVYTLARWNMPPAKLIRDRLQSSMAVAGGTVMELRDIRPQDLMLRIELEEFSQHFDSTFQSVGQVAWRASLFQGRALVVQKRFLYSSPAPSADAAGGARALAAASDKLIGEMIVWMIDSPWQK